jgi:hypothetical protein
MFRIPDATSEKCGRKAKKPRRELRRGCSSASSCQLPKYYNLLTYICQICIARIAVDRASPAFLNISRVPQMFGLSHVLRHPTERNDRSKYYVCTRGVLFPAFLAPLGSCRGNFFAHFAQPPQRFDRIFEAMLITGASRIFQPWIE